MRMLEEQRRRDARRRLVAAVRSSALLSRVSAQPWPGVAASIGVSSGSLLEFFPREEDLLDAIVEELVAETSARLETATRRLPRGVDDPVRELVRVVVAARPLDRSGLLVRLERRARALREGRDDETASRAEQHFLAVLPDVIGRLLAVVDREFAIPAGVASRALLNSYERAFEAWLLQGHDESDFAASRFATEALPVLVTAMSRPRSTPSGPKESP